MALVSDRRCLLFFGCTSSRIFENIPQNGPEYPYRNLAIATFLVTAARINIGDCCPGWSHSQAQSLNYLSMGWEGAFMSIPSGGGGGSKAWYMPVSLAVAESVHSSSLPKVCHVKFL